MKSPIIFILFFSTIVAACGGQPASDTPASFGTPLSNQVPVHQEPTADGHNHVHVDPSQVTTDVQVALVASELVVGPNRFAVGLLDSKGQAIREATVHFHYFDLSKPDAPVLESEADAVRVQTPDGLTAIFAHEREFKRAGNWGVEVQARLPNGGAAVKRVGFEVIAQSPTLKPGQQAPAVDTPTAADVNNDLRKISTAVEPNPAFYRLSLAKALTNGKPTVLLFATPAFCQTRFCGPSYEIVNELYKRYGDALNFIHVEVYIGLPNPAAVNWPLAPAMKAFGLHSEPWVFLINRDGKVFWRVEGVFTAAEIEQHLRVMPGT